MNKNQIKPILEAAILAADKPLKVSQMKKLFENSGHIPDIEHLREALDELVHDCKDRGVELKEIAGGYRYTVRLEYAEHVAALWEERPPKYSHALLETLALIAYRQPVTRADIENVRGVSVSSYIIKTLSERGWVKVIGHKEVPGRPALYATTNELLDYFNLKSLNELPTLKEIADLDKINPELELIEVNLPVEKQQSEHGDTDTAESLDADIASNPNEQVEIVTQDPAKLVKH